MKALILNGSPRKGGNTTFVCEVISGLLAEKYEGIETTVYRMQELTVAPCNGCDACKRNGGHCVIQDDGTKVAEEAAQADVLVFAMPVYQSGVPAQLKVEMDRMYSKGGIPADHKPLTYVVTIGADPLEIEHYSLIDREFSILCPYENWDYRGYCALRALEKDELRNREGVKEQLENLLNK